MQVSAKIPQIQCALHTSSTIESPVFSGLSFLELCMRTLIMGMIVRSMMELELQLDELHDAAIAILVTQ